MTPEQIPDELMAILDERAGRQHSRTGSVASCLAEILTRWEEIRDEYVRRVPGAVRHVEGD